MKRDFQRTKMFSLGSEEEVTTLKYITEAQVQAVVIFVFGSSLVNLRER